MFHGSIPTGMRSFVAETVNMWGRDEVWVGCSGNFTIERTLPTLKHHANDVTLYSGALGWWGVGEGVPISLKEEFHDELGWLLPGMETDTGRTATVMLGTRFFASVGKDNRYHRRQYGAHKAQWDKLLAETSQRLENSGLKLESYHNGDVVQWLDDVVPSEGAVICFPPFFKGDYESQDKNLAKFLDWPAPTYDLLDEEGKVDLINKITDREHWIIGLHERHPQLEPNLRGIMQTTNRGVPINLYTSDSPVRVVGPRQDIDSVAIPRLTEDVELTGNERVWMGELTGGQFSALRSQYMNHRIRPGSPLLALGLMLDDYLIGCIAFSSPTNVIDSRQAYMLSDFPVTESRYTRLSALVVRLAQSTEVKQLLERTLSRGLTSISTTAFSNNPVSMKYRSGGMTLYSRKPSTDGIHENQLQYEAPAGRWTLAEGFAEWLSKHGTKVRSQS